MNEQETIAAIRGAAERLGADPERMRRLDVFLTYWPDIEAYTPPPEVAEDVHQITLAFRHLASLLAARPEEDRKDG